MKWLGQSMQRFVIAMMVMALFGGAIIVMTFVEIPNANRDAVIQLVGGVNMLAGLVVGWYFKGLSDGASGKRDDPVHIEDDSK